MSSKKHIYIFFVLLPFSAIANDEKCHSSSIKNNILNNLSSIESYRLNIISTIDENSIYSEVIGQHPNKLKVITTHKDKYNSTTLNLYNGTYQWVEVARGKTSQAIKIDLSKIVSNEMPFDSGYYVYGTGLLSGEDYIGTIKTLLTSYSFTASCKNNKVVLTGNINEDSFKKYALKKKSFNKNLRNIERYTIEFPMLSIAFNSGNLFPLEYRLGNKLNTARIHVKFKILSLNEVYNNDYFRYKQTKGITPTDITQDLLNQARSNE